MHSDSQSHADPKVAKRQWAFHCNVFALAMMTSFACALSGCTTENSHAGNGGHGGDAFGGGAGYGGFGGDGGGFGGDLPACNTKAINADSDIFDANEVYLVGTTEEAACWKHAVAHWSSPDVYVNKFDCEVDDRTAVIRPSDGRMLYTRSDDFLLREFHCDNCLVNGNMPTDDPIIPTPLCGGPQAGVGFSILVTPSGGIRYSCTGYQWNDEMGTEAFVIKSGKNLLRLGNDNHALTKDSVVDLTAGIEMPLVNWPKHPIRAIRARESGGFLVALSEDEGVTSLWEIAPTGWTKKLGNYPPFPEGRKYDGGSSQLEPCGALVQVGRGPEVFQDIIVRRELNGTSAVVYDEATGPYVKLHGSVLMTGP